MSKLSRRQRLALGDMISHVPVAQCGGIEWECGIARSPSPGLALCSSH